MDNKKIYLLYSSIALAVNKKQAPREAGSKGSRIQGVKGATNKLQKTDEVLKNQKLPGFVIPVYKPELRGEKDGRAREEKRKADIEKPRITIEVTGHCMQ